jgi:hypothetical protein
MCAMTDTPSWLTLDTTPSPVPRRSKHPSWLDLRLVLGVVLVLAAILLGAVVVSTADKREAVWALGHDVAAGTVLQSRDLREVRVQLGASAALYLPITEAIAGRQTQHQLRAGELLPRAEVANAEQGITVTLPVRPENAPNMSPGDRITVWVTTKTCRGAVVLSGITVQSVKQGRGAAFGTNAALGVVVRLDAGDAQRVVSALDLDGAMIRLGVLSAGQKADVAQQSLAGCAGAAAR